MRGKIGLHYGLQRCNAQRAALACVGEGSREYRLPIVGAACCRLSEYRLQFVGLPAADCRDACCRSGGCLERVVLMPCTI